MKIQLALSLRYWAYQLDIFKLLLVEVIVIQILDAQLEKSVIAYDDRGSVHNFL